MIKCRRHAHCGLQPIRKIAIRTNSLGTTRNLIAPSLALKPDLWFVMTLLALDVSSAQIIHLLKICQNQVKAYLSFHTIFPLSNTSPTMRCHVPGDLVEYGEKIDL